jgi:hypothetical protein
MLAESGGGGGGGGGSSSSKIAISNCVAPRLVGRLPAVLTDVFSDFSEYLQHIPGHYFRPRPIPSIFPSNTLFIYESTARHRSS